MKLPDNPRERKAAIIAASVTFGLAVIILVLLFVFSIGVDRREMAYASEPEIQDEEEIYLEPELMMLESAGDPDSEEDDTPAPSVPGIAAPGPDDPVQEFTNDKEPETQPVKTIPTQTVKESEGAPMPDAQKSDKGEKKSTAPPGVEIEWNKGSGNKVAANYDVGGDGLGAKGNLSGRKLKKCPLESPKGQGNVTITVSVTVNAAGKVEGEPKVIGGNGSADDKAKCISMARKSEWEPAAKKNAPNATGKITFYISHK